MSAEFVDDFWIHRLVFINSGGCANVELPMSSMGLLLGRNNSGKTSSISALKLFILPETNFNDCEKKFGFVSNNVFHKSHESANFYLPTDRSFIICEAQNTKGVFCIILHRSNEEWGYARIAVQETYETIKHVFWDFDSQYNQGFGRNHPELTLKSVKEELKPFKPDFLTRPDEVREAIYSRPGPINDLSKYCLIPLPKKGEKREVDALRALLDLAFRISGSEKLAGAIASIIETENAGKDGNLSVDILEINREYEELKAEGTRLSCVAANQSIWSALNSVYKRYIQEKEHFQRNLSVLLGHEVALKELMNEQVKENNLAIEAISKEFSQAKDGAKSANDKLISSTGELKEKEKDVSINKKSRDLVDMYWSKYKSIDGVDDFEGMAAYLSEQLPAIKEEIEACKNKDVAKSQLEALSKELSDKNTKIEALKKDRLNDSRYTLESVSPHSRSVLFSLNDKFGSMKCPITEKQASAIGQFGELFEINQSRLSFLDENMEIFHHTFDPEIERSKRDEKINEKLREHRKISDRLQRINDIANGAIGNLDELLKEQSEFEAVLKKISAYDHIVEAISIKEAEIERLANDEMPLIKAASNEANDRLSAITTRKINIEDQSRMLGSMKNDLERYSSKLHLSMLNLDQIFRDESLNQNILPSQKNDADDINSFGGLVDSFQVQCNEIKGLKQNIFKNLEVLSNEPLLPEYAPVDIEVNVGFDRVSKLYESLRAIFENYDDNLVKYQRDIESHNNQTGVRAAAVGEISKLIDSFRKSINKELGNIHVSNLSSVELVIEVDQRFMDLLTDLNSISFSGDQLLSDSIYKRLTAFCDEFFKGVTGYGKRIQLDRIITNVRYDVAVDGIKIRSQQSTGTTGMINTVLLALLLKRMVPASVKLHFPIIFDEVLNLDSINLKTIKKVVEENSFILFVVCPNNAGIVADAIPNWYDLSLHKLSDGLILPRCEVLHFALTESLVDEELA